MKNDGARKLLEPLPLGENCVLPTRLIPGPMEGVTAGAWLSQLSSRKWVQCWWTPFLRISTGVPRLRRLKDWLAPFLCSGFPVIAQLMGNHPELLAEAAGRLFQAGAAAVDLNCACPSNVVVGNCSGGFCLKNPGWIADTLRQMRMAVGKHPLGVKIRTGWASPDELPEIAAAVRKAAPDFVTVHFRTVSEGYRPVDNGLERMALARKLLEGMTLIGSGDLMTSDNIIRMTEQCGVDAVAPARGMLANPRLLAETAACLRGECLPVFDDDDWQDFLDGCVRDGATRGFVLQMAANMYGKNSPFFQKQLEK